MRFTLALALTAAAASSAVAHSTSSHSEHFSRDYQSIEANSTLFEARQVFHEDGEWFDVGLMMARGEESIVDRDQEHEARGVAERWENFPVERDASGDISLPRNYAEAKRMLKNAGSLAKRKLMSGTVRVTWYSGADLKGPSCGDWRLGYKWHPTDKTYNAAVTASWKGKEKPTCKSLIRLTTPKGRSVIVRVVDSCASSAMSPSNSCTRGLKVVDLTKAAFKALAPLDQGIIDRVKVETIHIKKGHKWNKGDIKKWGPWNF